MKSIASGKRQVGHAIGMHARLQPCHGLRFDLGGCDHLVVRSYRSDEGALGFAERLMRNLSVASRGPWQDGGNEIVQDRIVSVG
jgi:hypothetical protein